MGSTWKKSLKIGNATDNENEQYMHMLTKFGSACTS